MPSARGLAIALSIVATAAGACKRKDDAPRPAPIGPSGNVNAPAPAPTLPVAAAAPAAGGGGTISGHILLAPARKGDVSPNDVVYLVARRIADNPSARGALVAVKRYTAASFPIDFTLGAGDMMFQNGAFDGEMSLAARVDKDGDPITRRKGDVFGTVDRVRVGATGVDVKLDQLQKEDESLAGPGPAQGSTGHP